MTTLPPQHSREPDLAVDRYLDNLMSPTERADFDRRLAAAPELMAEVQRQRSVDAVLRHYAKPPSPEVVLAAIRHHIEAGERAGGAVGETPGPRLGLRPGWRRLAVAAVLLLGLLGAWQVYRALTPTSGNYDPGPHRTLVQAYQATVDKGFHSDWTCRDDAEFALTFFDQFGQMLSMNPPLPDHTLALGLEYYDILSRKTIGMLTRVSEQPVMIFIDRLENDKQAVPPIEEGKHIFRRELGDLVLYEVTPLNHPGLLHHLRQPTEIPKGEGPHDPG